MDAVYVFEEEQRVDARTEDEYEMELDEEYYIDQKIPEEWTRFEDECLTEESSHFIVTYTMEDETVAFATNVNCIINDWKKLLYYFFTENTESLYCEYITLKINNYDIFSPELLELLKSTEYCIRFIDKNTVIEVKDDININILLYDEFYNYREDFISYIMKMDG